MRLHEHILFPLSGSALLFLILDISVVDSTHRSELSLIGMRVPPFPAGPHQPRQGSRPFVRKNARAFER